MTDREQEVRAWIGDGLNPTLWQAEWLLTALDEVRQQSANQEECARVWKEHFKVAQIDRGEVARQRDEALAALAQQAEMEAEERRLHLDCHKEIDIVFDGPPSHDAPRFIEVESPPGRSIKFGTWMQRPDDGYWVLRFSVEKCDGNHAGPRCADPECWHD